MRILNLALRMGIVLLAASCSGSDEMPGGDAGDTSERVALRVSALAIEGEAAVTQAVSPGVPVSRAATSAPIGTGKSVGFFVKADAGKYAAQNNVKGVYKTLAGSLQAWVPADSIWLNRNDATVMVYYPYFATQSTSTLPLAPKLYPAGSDEGDLSYVRFTANNRYLVEGNKKIDLTLAPVYSRLVVTVIKDATYPTEVKIAKISVSGTNICSIGSFNMETEAYSRTAGNVTVSFTDQTVGLAGAASPATIDLLLIPNTLTATISLTLEPDGKKTTAVIDRSKFGDSLDAGKKYTVTVKLKPGTLTPEVGNVTVVDWTSGGSVNSDTEFD